MLGVENDWDSIHTSGHLGMDGPLRIRTGKDVLQDAATVTRIRSSNAIVRSKYRPGHGKSSEDKLNHFHGCDKNVESLDLREDIS